ncbi:actin-like ATPase domain-containing protein [Pluteus cervinus]|uniref:Actin-like ATPase domain-containing protein n=1 Tax=Pluteus cervinus TaxID=181527 RepID=A0ACD3BAQ8_9AGAR|nr:actin-like ATPase domain-containing protein [Pluteus cervinus]
MPRGIPNARRDETGMKFTTFHVPLATNPKHMTSYYLKSETQTQWARNAAKRNKSQNEETSAAPEQRRGSQVLVIHPGSRFLRIGKASDVTPVSVHNIVARKCKTSVPKPSHVERISRPRFGRRGAPSDGKNLDDPFDAKVSTIVTALRDRMKFYKLRITPNATSIASTFNEQFQPEIIAEHNDPFRIEWIRQSDEHTIVGETAHQIADPQQSGYLIRQPILGTSFNTRDYPSIQAILSDLEVVIETTLKEKFNINRADYANYSIVLVIPDFYDRSYVRELVNLLLMTMGFKQLCAQQESLAATYGAGISNACVVNIGATTTNIACVDEGLVISDTRMSLNMGGDDITEFLYVLLGRIHFPYRDCDLACSYDWNVMEDLKTRLCTLLEGDVALNLYDFAVRRPDRPTEKYGLRAYDEMILAPMCLFEPRVIEFNRKRAGLRPYSSDVTDEIIEHQGDHVTNAMMISTQHLMALAAPPDGMETPLKTATAPPSGSNTPKAEPEGRNAVDEMVALSVDGGDAAEGEDTKPTTGRASTSKTQQNPQPLQYPGGLSIDVCFEASKLPLDVAIFNSTRAAGGDEKIRKYLQAVLVIGGTARISGMAPALESRLQAIATPLVPNMEKVQIIPPPKDVDHRVLVWKGAAVLGKMDGVSELWITPRDWDLLGMRGLKERCFYL